MKSYIIGSGQGGSVTTPSVPCQWVKDKSGAVRLANSGLGVPAQAQTLIYNGQEQSVSWYGSTRPTLM